MFSLCLCKQTLGMLLEKNLLRCLGGTRFLASFLSWKRNPHSTGKLSSEFSIILTFILHRIHVTLQFIIQDYVLFIFI
uniref:Putative ovule protein n=1 Tax=Solanum chacoense TaxID=4108 RepID=A0A0V0GS34_SOLCH